MYNRNTLYRKSEIVVKMIPDPSRYAALRIDCIHVVFPSSYRQQLNEKNSYIEEIEAFGDNQKNLNNVDSKEYTGLSLLSMIHKSCNEFI